MGGPMPSFTSGKSSSTAAASRCAAECRKTKSASLSLAVRISSLALSVSGRERSTSSPSTRATSASLASDPEICRAISAGVVPFGTSRRAPSGKVMAMVSMCMSRRFRGNSTLTEGSEQGQGGLPGRSEERYAGESAEGLIGGDEFRLERAGCCVNNRVRHGQFELQAGARGSKRQDLVQWNYLPAHCL